MKKLVSFDCFGVACVPWSVPEIGVSRRGPKPVRFTKRSKKSKLHEGKASLDDWQRYVKLCATEAMQAIPIPIGSIKLHIEFHSETPKGKRHGELWNVPLRWNDEASEYTKTQPRGKPEADLVNMFKGTEDALQGAVFANDVQTRMLSSVAIYGPMNGIRVFVYTIEDTDFVGIGEPVK